MLVADPVNELEGFPSDHVALVELLAAHAGAALEVDRLSESFTELRRLERELRHHALHDALTGLANRVLFVERLKHALTRRSEAPLAVLFIDLDDFKSVNDTHGHAAGDQVLISVATRLQRCLRPHDTAARLGGDEFGVLLEDVVDEAEADGYPLASASSTTSWSGTPNSSPPRRPPCRGGAGTAGSPRSISAGSTAA